MAAAARLWPEFPRGFFRLHYRCGVQADHAEGIAPVAPGIDQGFPLAEIIRDQDLLGEARKTLALGYLEQSRLSITEISFMLGFNDTSSFNRALKRWKGKAPSEFRVTG